MAKKSDSQMIKEIIHILGIFTLFVGPLLIYFLKKEKDIQKEAKKVLNWQFSLFIYFCIASLIHSLLFFAFPFFNLHNILMLVNVILSVIGFVKVSNKEHWEYPLSIRFFKI